MLSEEDYETVMRTTADNSGDAWLQAVTKAMQHLGYHYDSGRCECGINEGQIPLYPFGLMTKPAHRFDCGWHKQG